MLLNHHIGYDKMDKENKGKGAGYMKRSKKILLLTMTLSLWAVIPSYGEQSDRWHSDQNGVWYLKSQDNTGNVLDSWFQDLDGSWYLLAPGDGHMYAGLIHDTITDQWYYCQTEHDGFYGKMASTDGNYTINGKEVRLTFNQKHDGCFGAITSGLDSILGTGIAVTDVAGIPTESEAELTEDTTEEMTGQWVNGVYLRVPKGDDSNASETATGDTTGNNATNTWERDPNISREEYSLYRTMESTKTYIIMQLDKLHASGKPEFQDLTEESIASLNYEELCELYIKVIEEVGTGR